MTTLGLVQYIGPTLQFVVGLLVFKETFSTERLIGFGLIWLALVIYTLDGWRVSRQGRTALAASLPQAATASGTELRIK